MDPENLLKNFSARLLFLNIVFVVGILAVAGTALNEVGGFSDYYSGLQLLSYYSLSFLGVAAIYGIVYAVQNNRHKRLAGSDVTVVVPQSEGNRPILYTVLSVLLPLPFTTLLLVGLVWFVSRFRDSLAEPVALLAIVIIGLCALFVISKAHRKYLFRPLSLPTIGSLPAKSWAITLSIVSFIVQVVVALVVSGMAWILVDETYHPID